MKLSRLMAEIPGVTLATGGNPEAEIKGLAHDSREVKPGFLFALLPSASGRFTDTPKYLKQALSLGAAAVLVPQGTRLKSRVPVLMSGDTREAYAQLCAAFFGHPSRRLALVGVTGTNGKTTTTFLLRSILNAAGKPAAVLGTVGYFVGKKVFPAPNTTPSSKDLQGLMRGAVKAGDKAVVMEVSSHALDQKRASALEFDAAVFTNLTRDHLDYHGTMDRYLQAKAELFKFLGKGTGKKAAAVINRDDKRWKKLAGYVPKGTRVLTYAVSDVRANVRASSLRLASNGSGFQIKLPQGVAVVKLPLPGRFNVSNALAAAAAAHAMGISPRAIALGLSKPQTPPGRMERVQAGQAFGVVVDYAHTPDALERALKTLKECAAGRVITVFGCGGDRDKGKRPEMGAIAYRLSDLVLVTSDNPRSENPEAIIQDVLRGIPDERGGVRRVLALADREQAIARAIKVARPDDVVLIAGKGHEDYQILGDKKIHFDDREVAARYIKKYLS